MDAHETALYTAIMISATIIGIIIVYFFISIIRHQRRNQELHQSRILAEITTLERERQRLSADMHDELGPILASVKFKLSSVELSSLEDRLVVAKVNDNLDDLIMRLRGISNDLVPHTLMRKGLVAAMEESVNRFNHSNNLDLKFVHFDIPVLPQDKAINLYRILQEIIHNTIKHARATELKLELKTSHQHLVLLSQDDGIGFDTLAASRENGGLGLRNLLSRTEIMGGNMYIESSPGKGTCYTFEIPL